MAKFLTTVGNSFYIEQIILNAEKNLTLVTPYLNLSQNLIDRLIDANKEGIKITLIYGKSELNKAEKKKLESLNNIEIFFCENLHAKCYLNEQSMIITSMNLYEFSERNNREMGILVERESDSQIFLDALKEIDSIKNASKLQKASKKNDLSEIMYLSDDHREKWDFFQPSLSRVLKKKYKDYNIEYDENEGSVSIIDFPIKGIDLKLDRRVEYCIEDQSLYTYIRNNYYQIFRDALPNLRFYWNLNLCIYLEKNFDVDVDFDGLNKIVSKYTDIIGTTSDLLIKACNAYRR